MVRKAEKKRNEKNKTDLVCHQHKSINGNIIRTHGFDHNIALKHKKKTTQLAHDTTIRLDNQLKGATSNG